MAATALVLNLFRYLRTNERCWHSNAYFSLFSSLFFFDPPNRFVQIPRDLSSRQHHGIRNSENSKANRIELARSVGVHDCSSVRCCRLTAPERSAPP